MEVALEPWTELNAFSEVSRNLNFENAKVISTISIGRFGIVHSVHEYLKKSVGKSFYRKCPYKSLKVKKSFSSVKSAVLLATRSVNKDVNIELKFSFTYFQDDLSSLKAFKASENSIDKLLKVTKVSKVADAYTAHKVCNVAKVAKVAKFYKVTKVTKVVKVCEFPKVLKAYTAYKSPKATNVSEGNRSEWNH